jgi:2-C-methyl-D-erythritol 4-phosphate cytidylyltransferase
MNIAIIFAGGIGSRMNMKTIPKQFLELNGKPIIIYTLEVFERSDYIDKIIISCLKDWINYLRILLNKYNISKAYSIVEGGETGQLSIYNGLISANKNFPANSIVLIHDGVRPIISNDLLKKSIEDVNKFGSSITYSQAKETCLIYDKEKNIIPDRSKLKIIKAPQCFILENILSLHERALKDGYTNIIDSCTLMNMYDFKMYFSECGSENIKITTPEDFYLFKAILEAKENYQLFGYINY